MIAGWTIGAWMAVVGIPVLLAGFSIVYFIIGDKEIGDKPDVKESDK